MGGTGMNGCVCVPVKLYKKQAIGLIWLWARAESTDVHACRGQAGTPKWMKRLTGLPLAESTWHASRKRGSCFWLVGTCDWLSDTRYDNSRAAGNGWFYAKSFYQLATNSDLQRKHCAASSRTPSWAPSDPWNLVLHILRCNCVLCIRKNRLAGHQTWIANNLAPMSLTNPSSASDWHQSSVTFFPAEPGDNCRILHQGSKKPQPINQLCPLIM